MARYRLTTTIHTDRPLTAEEEKILPLDLKDLMEVNGLGVTKVGKPKLQRLRKGESKDHPAKALLVEEIERLTDKIAALKPENFDGQDSVDRRRDRQNHGYAREMLKRVLYLGFPAE